MTCKRPPVIDIRYEERIWKQQLPLGLPCGPRQRPFVGFCGEVVSYEQGTPVQVEAKKAEEEAARVLVVNSWKTVEQDLAIFGVAFFIKVGPTKMTTQFFHTYISITCFTVTIMLLHLSWQ